MQTLSFTPAGRPHEFEQFSWAAYDQGQKRRAANRESQCDGHEFPVGHEFSRAVRGTKIMMDVALPLAEKIGFGG
jgi:hypothetical protein